MTVDKQAIIQEVQQRQGIMGMRITGFIADTIEANCGMYKAFYTPLKRGRKEVAGSLVFTVMATSFITDGNVLVDAVNDEVHNLTNGLSVVFIK